MAKPMLRLNVVCSRPTLKRRLVYLFSTIRYVVVDERVELSVLFVSACVRVCRTQQRLKLGLHYCYQTLILS